MNPRGLKISKETIEEAQKTYLSCKDSVENFTNKFLKDDESIGFQVPTRNYMVQGLTPSFQSEIFKKLDSIKTLKRIALASPRSFMKSTTCSVEFPMHSALFRHFKEILIVSNSEALAINFLRAIKINIESNAMIHKYFGNFMSDKWTETQIILANGVSIRACGWGAQIRGFRPDLIIFDDIESDETVLSEDIRRKMKEWILKAAINSITVEGCIVWVGTLISRLAVIHEFIHTPPHGWTSVFNQAYREGVEESGHELWPEVWTHERLQQRKKEIGSWAFASEFMNTPIPSEGNRFNPATFRYFDNKDVESKDLGMYIAIDPAFSENSSADYGVIMSCLHDSKDNIYVDRYYRARTTAGNLIQVLKQIYKANRNRIRAVGVEEVGPQKMFYQQMVNECNQEGLYPPFKKLTGMISTQRGNMRNKEDRITYSLQPRFESGKIYIRKEQHELIDELTTFPESKHDDLCDSLAYVTALVEPFMTYEDSLSIDDLTPELIINHGVTGYGDSYEQDEKEYPSFG